MYTVSVGLEHKYTVSTVKEAFELAIDYFKYGAECDIVSELTGEVLLILRDHDLPYVAEAISYAI